METTVIGGNLSEINDSADRLVKSGKAALDTSTNTSTAAGDVQEAITTTMDDLIKRFGAIGDELKADIKAAHAQLSGTNWTGKSQQAALEIKTDLERQVNKILTDATTSFTDERNAMVARSTQMVDAVNDQFNKIMVDVDDKYNALANASKQTATNLAQADETIKVGSVG